MPFVVASCTAPMPTLVSPGTEICNASLPAPGSPAISAGLGVIFAGKLVQSSTAPSRRSPKKVTVVVLSGATADGEMRFNVGLLATAAQANRNAAAVSKGRLVMR